MNFLKCSKTARLILRAIFPTLPNVLRIFCLPKKNRDVMILKFNGLRGEFQINYACGYAYSEDYSGLTLLDLLNEAKPAAHATSITFSSPLIITIFI